MATIRQLGKDRYEVADFSQGLPHVKCVFHAPNPGVIMLLSREGYDRAPWIDSIARENLRTHLRENPTPAPVQLTLPL